ncbi:MAG: hypothetical protein WD063_14370 [Pirellulales bacterium]
MADDPARLIEAWFAQHADDDEFIRAEPPAYTAFPPGDVPGKFVYATKPHPALLALDQCGESARLGVIAPSPGLPLDCHVDWMSPLVADHDLLFLGDMDPVDLLIFAWVRAKLSPKPIVYLGVSDAYLLALNVSIARSFTLQFTPSEQESMSLLSTVFPDYREVVGESCSRLLEQARKIELEAVVSALGSPAVLLLPALGDDHA